MGSEMCIRDRVEDVYFFTDFNMIEISRLLDGSITTDVEVCAMACGGTGRRCGEVGLHRGGLDTVERSVLSPVPSHSACEERWLKLLAAKNLHALLR